MSSSTQFRKGAVVGICLLVAVAAVYWPAQSFDFLNYDDDAYLTKNEHVRGGLTPSAVGWAFTNRSLDHWVPVTWMARMAQFHLWGPNAGPMHAVNVILHAINSVLLFTILVRMTGATWRSAFVAGLFALHPLHVESVAWVTGLKDVLSGCFWMLTIYAYLRYVERPVAARYLLTLALFALGLMSKPTVLTLPFVLILLDLWPLQRCHRLREVRWREKVPFFALTIASAIVTLLQQQTAGSVMSLEALSTADRTGNAIVSYARYLGKTFWPTGLAVFYPLEKWTWQVVLAAGALLVAITGAAVSTVRRFPHVAVGWFWYLGTLVPVIGLVQSGGQSIADRYTYLPLIGVFVMVAWSVIPARLIGRTSSKVLTAVFAAVILGACCIITRAQLQYWRNSETLFRHALDVTRDNWMAHTNLGETLLSSDRVDEAIPHLERAIQIYPGFAKAHNLLGIAHARQGRLDDAVSCFALALAINPGLTDVHYNLGMALIQLGRIEEALDQLEYAVRANPNDAVAHNDIGTALAALGRMPEAVAHWEQAVKLQPDFAEARSNLALAVKSVGTSQDHQNQ